METADYNIYIRGIRCEPTEWVNLVHYRVQIEGGGGGTEVVVNPEVKIQVLLTLKTLPPGRLLVVYQTFPTESDSELQNSWLNLQDFSNG
jgi:hypothetical protein